MKHGERADVRNNGEAVWAVHSIDANHVAAADVRADQGDQRVGGVANKGHVHRPAETDIGDLLRQTAGERRDLPGFGVNARDPAGCGFGDVERTIGADGAARAALQAGRQQGGGTGCDTTVSVV